MLAKPDRKPDVLAYEPSSLIFRIGIGGMALLFLAIIIFGNMIVTGPRILDAISAYYYSPMRNFFIGSLSVLGTLLICYRYQRVDKFAGIVAGLCVIFLAICPREPSSADLMAICPTDPRKMANAFSFIHMSSGSLLPMCCHFSRGEPGPEAGMFCVYGLSTNRI
jgi:hypothetical protein